MTVSQLDLKPLRDKILPVLLAEPPLWPGLRPLPPERPFPRTVTRPQPTIAHQYSNSVAALA